MSTITHNHSPAELDAGPGALMGDPVANALWAAVLKLDAAWQHELLERLRTYLVVPELTGGRRNVRAVLLVSSVREAHALRREELADTAGPDFEPSAPVLLSEEHYERLRARHRECGWPPAPTLRRWAQGGWNDVLRRARLNPVPGGDVMTDSRLGVRYTWAHVSGALREYRDWRAARGYPLPEEFGMHDYISWAELPAIAGLPGRRPRAQSVFDRMGGFPTAKAAALANEPDEPTADPMRPSVRAGLVRARSGYDLPEEVLVASLRLVARTLGWVPRAGEFKAKRRELLQGAERDGQPVPFIASYGVINARYGPWDAALVAAGLEPFGPVDIDPETKRARAAGARNHISDDDVHAGIVEAHQALGEPFGNVAYREWVLANDKVSPQTGRRLATYSCVYSRYRHHKPSPWAAACAAAGVRR